MRSFLRRLLVLAFVLGLAVVGLGQSAALAAPIPSGPTQPGTAPFSGVTFTAAGDIGQPGGLTWTFHGLSGNLAPFLSVEWGPTDPNAIKLALNGDQTFSTPGQILTLSSVSANTAVWTGSTPYTTAQPAQTVTLMTRFTMTAGAVLKATSGYGDGATVPVTGDFMVTLLFEVSADNGVTWTPATEYFNSQQNVPGNTIQSSFNGGFFYLFNSHLSLSPNPMNFGTVQLGQSSTMTLTFTNSGTAPTRVPQWVGT